MKLEKKKPREEIQPEVFKSGIELTGRIADINAGKKLLFTDEEFRYNITALKWDSNQYGSIEVKGAFWDEFGRDPEEEIEDDEYISTKYKMLPASHGVRFILDGDVAAFRIVKRSENVYHAEVCNQVLLEAIAYKDSRVIEICCDPDGVVRFYGDSHRMIACLLPELHKKYKHRIINGAEYRHAYKVKMEENLMYLAPVIFAFPFIRFGIKDEVDSFDNTEYYESFCEYNERAGKTIADLEALDELFEDPEDAAGCGSLTELEKEAILLRLGIFCRWPRTREEAAEELGLDIEKVKELDEMAIELLMR